MRPLGLATERIQWLRKRCCITAPIERKPRQCCADCVSRDLPQRVLYVGAERSDEFADGLRLERCGHAVIVVNPRKTGAARRFANAGGTFIQGAIERLPLTPGPFDLVCESYPFAVAPVPGLCEEDPCPIWLSGRPMRAYATARLRQLAPRGRRIVFTESPGFAGALRSIVHLGPGMRRNFTIRIVPTKTDEAPRSLYPRLSTRFKVILQRRPAELLAKRLTDGNRFL